MKDLYKMLETKEELVSNSKDNQNQALNSTNILSQIVNTFIENLLSEFRVYDAYKIWDSYRVNRIFRITIYAYNDKEPKLSGGTTNISIYLPKDNYEELMHKVDNFCATYFGATIRPIEYQLFENVRSIEYISFPANLAALSHVSSLMTQCNESNKVEHAFDSLYTQLYDTVHAKFFEEEFLDKYIVEVIKRYIIDIDNKNIDELKENNYPIYNHLRYSIGINCSNESHNRKTLTILNQELKIALIGYIKEFMEFYNLGTVRLVRTSLYGINSHPDDADYYVVEFDTTIKNLITAYYMEKQRIEQYLTIEAYQYQKNKKTNN